MKCVAKYLHQIKVMCSAWSRNLPKEGVHVRIKQHNCEICGNKFASKSKSKFFFWGKDFHTDVGHEWIKPFNNETLHPNQG